MIWEKLYLCCCFVCLFCFLSLSVSCYVLVGVCFFFILFSLFFFGGVEVWVGLGWVGLFFLKSPGQFISCFFRVTNLSALLLLYCDAFFFFFFFCFSMTVGTNWCFCFFPYFSAGFSWNDVHSLTSSFFLGFSHFPALFFIQHKYLLVPTGMASQHLLCHLYKALLYVHDIELVEIGVWWTMSVCFFPPHQT